MRTSDWTPARAAAAEAVRHMHADSSPDRSRRPQPIPPKSAGETEGRNRAKPAPQKLLPQKINFSADALFDFDKADLRPEGKAMLEDLTRVLQGATLRGHSGDRSRRPHRQHEYNQKLSVRRAETVKKYLVEKGIAPNRVYAEGKGETQPLTKPADCRMKNRKALIACLQPDRRVDVEVTGTKQ